MNREQIEAWLALEGWQAVLILGTLNPTLVNFSKDEYIGHFYLTARPLSQHACTRVCISRAEPRNYSDLNPEYFTAAVDYLMSERDKS